MDTTRYDLKSNSAIPDEACIKNSQDYKFPDPEDFINSSYMDFSILELQDVLIAFSKSISETKARLNYLIPKNFAKFISCKGTMEQICDDYSKNNIASSNSSSSISFIVSKFESLLKKHNINLDEIDEESVTIEVSEDAAMMNLKEMLRSNILNFSIFMETLGKYRKLVENSKKLDAIKPEIIDFLTAVYEKIVGEETPFEEMCNLTDIYLTAASYQNDYTFDQKRLKIMNTILVNFKESTYSRMRVSDEYYKYLFKSIIKVLEYLKEEQVEEAIHHFFKMFYSLLCKTDPKYCRIVLRQIADFTKSINTTASSIREFRESLSDLKTDLFNFFVSTASVDECVEIFNVFLSIFNERETKKAQDILLKKTERHLISSERHGFEFLRDQAKDVKTISSCLGSRESRNMKQLKKRIGEKKDAEIQEIVKGFKLSFEVLNGVDDGVINMETKILMEAVKIIDRSKEYHTQILCECRDLIVKHGVILYFLRSYLKLETPVLSEEERNRVESLSFQFGFLVN
ncbi:uncharacterized protein VICG_00356 [Vittaforma corneae ATCC 50505]|uniref:Uncharacterized protein n=1 Tax=Vittaforma corneae (strain ATCC 50505) TaxID=993615 RepID=L2GPU1_VITCO|nr:uncharacterized protein VICG_00356 [Vittaforma corneae ATCC 50505]ELA42604.1 hypothetical protein VICG_00356 [Vittaforma corneae ATCC 50505]